MTKLQQVLQQAETQKELLALDRETANTKAEHALAFISCMIESEHVLSNHEAEVKDSALTYLLCYFEEDFKVADKTKS